MADKIEILEYTTYITQEQDTFDLIAYRQYGNEMLAHLIIQENPRYADTLIFDGGIKLNVPIISETEISESLPPWRKDDANEADV